MEAALHMASAALPTEEEMEEALAGAPRRRAAREAALKECEELGMSANGLGSAATFLEPEKLTALPTAPTLAPETPRTPAANTEADKVLADVESTASRVRELCSALRSSTAGSAARKEAISQLHSILEAAAAADRKVVKKVRACKCFLMLDGTGSRCIRMVTRRRCAICTSSWQPSHPLVSFAFGFRLACASHPLMSQVVRAFVDAEGPEILYEMESCMQVCAHILLCLS